MLSKKIESALNDQLTREFFASQLYLSMSAYFTHENLSGFANWTYVQHQEEITHGIKFFKYINDKGGRVILKKIETPKSIWNSPVDVFKDVLAHEQKVTGLINKLVVIAKAEKDYATENMLQWFITEQVEEEANASNLLHKMKLIKNSNSGLLFLDNELSKRKFSEEARN